MDDEELLAEAEQALTQIKVSRSLSEEHQAVLTALRIRLKGSDTTSLEEMLEAADDPGPDSLDARLAQAEPKPTTSLDDLLAEEPKKPTWPG